MFSIPNILTLLNLVSGCIGIVMVLQGSPSAGAIWVWISVFFDYLDGFAARKMNIISPIGKELDSLADMVSFGVLPGIVIFVMMLPLEPFRGAAYLALIVPAFSALRLSKFNTDDRQSDTFYGLPTPSNALFLTSLAHIELSFLSNYWVLLVLAVVFSLLLISELRMFALKFKSFSFNQNKWKYLGILTSLTIVILLGIKGVSIVIAGYILVSLIIHFSRRNDTVT